MKRVNDLVALGVLVLAVAAMGLLVTACEDGSGSGREARMEASRERARQEAQRERELMARADAERARTDAAQDDLRVVMAVAFSCAALILLLAGVLVQERRARRALAEVLRLAVQRRKEVRR